MSPSTCPKLSPTNSCLARILGRTEIEITAVATSALEYGALEFGVLDFGALDNGTLEYGALVDNVRAKGSYTVFRLHEPSSKKPGIAGLVRRITFGTTKDKVNAITIIENHGKIRVHEKETLEKMTDNVKTTGSHIVPRPREAFNK